MVVLIGVALAIDVDPAVRWWFVAALVLSMLGDVFLMLPDERLFVAGLGSFLLGHLAYIGGLWTDGVSAAPLSIGLALVLIAVVVVGRPVVRSVRRGDDPSMETPVIAYMAVISLMVASAMGTGEALAIVGAGLFYCSDSLIAWRRFVRPKPWQPLAIIVTYHVAQAGLVLSLAT